MGRRLAGAVVVTHDRSPVAAQTRLARWRAWFYSIAVIFAAIGVWILANVAIALHDTHFDLTREKAYTPSSAAMRAVDELDRAVTVTYFYRSQDGESRRTRDLLLVMARRNPLLKVVAVDPDREPTLARNQGIQIYNAAVIEGEGRRVLVQGTDETEIAIGIQRVLRGSTITVCFLEGHGELPMDNFDTTRISKAAGLVSDASSGWSDAGPRYRPPAPARAQGYARARSSSRSGRNRPTARSSCRQPADNVPAS